MIKIFSFSQKIDSKLVDNTLFLKPLTQTLGYNGNNSIFSLDTLVGLPLSANANANIVSYRTFTIAFQGGFDGLNPTITSNKGVDITSGNVQGLKQRMLQQAWRWFNAENSKRRQIVCWHLE